ncbi:Hypothetical protein KVN_LOCUS335 [uncultured virus]|nr:Hypothetical protein KVN_LOCUS335 [uncultured virus]
MNKFLEKKKDSNKQNSYKLKKTMNENQKLGCNCGSVEKNNQANCELHFKKTGDGPTYMEQNGGCGPNCNCGSECLCSHEQQKFKIIKQDGGCGCNNDDSDKLSNLLTSKYTCSCKSLNCFCGLNNCGTGCKCKKKSMFQTGGCGCSNNEEDKIISFVQMGGVYKMFELSPNMLINKGKTEINENIFEYKYDGPVYKNNEDHINFDDAIKESFDRQKRISD